MHQPGLLNVLGLTPTEGMRRPAKGGGGKDDGDGGPEGRLEAYAAHPRLVLRVSEVEKQVRTAHDLLPVNLVGRLTLPRDLQALDREVEAAQGLALSGRVELAKRLDELEIHAKTVIAMVRDDVALLEWGNTQAGASKAKPLVEALAAIGDAIENCDASGYSPGFRALNDVHAEWQYALEDWARMLGRLHDIGGALSAIEKVASRLPPCKEMQALLGTAKTVAPLGGPMPPQMLEDGSWVKQREPLSQLELACDAFAAAPTLTAMLDDLDTIPLSGAWKERDTALLAVAVAIGKGDKAGLPIAVGAFDGLVRAAKEASDEIKQWLRELGDLKVPAAAVLKHVSSAAEGQLEFRAPAWLDACRERIAGPLLVARIAPETRASTGLEVEGYKTWVAEISTALSSNPNLLVHLAEAYKSKAISKDTQKWRLNLLATFEKGLKETTGFGARIAAAYTELLNTKGPWRERMKSDVAAQEISTWLKLHWALPNDDTTETLASLIASADKKAHELFERLGISLVLFNALRVHYPGMSSLLKTVKDYPDAVRLGHLVNSYLPSQVVNGANFAALVAASQVSLSGGGYRNPFRYFCAVCGMAEAEAKLDVMWQYATGGPPIVWGTVHVHYHGRTITSPNGATYYHVKVSDHAPSLGATGAVANVGARNLVNGAIPAGQTWA